MAFQLAVVVLLLAAFASQADAANFLYLVRQWGPGYCDTTSCSVAPPTTRFTIHGLWPNYGSGGYPDSCGGTQYSSTAISSIRTRMNAQWPSFTGSNDAFWAHEFNKHGTCAVSNHYFSGTLDYFSSTLTLNQNYNLLSALAASGITPSNTKKYTGAAINNAIYNDFGADPLIHCSSGRLTEIWQCFDENLNLEDCNTACYGSSCQNIDCSQSILIPAS
jgi:ribonuclease T2